MNQRSWGGHQRFPVYNDISTMKTVIRLQITLEFPLSHSGGKAYLEVDSTMFFFESSGTACFSKN